MDKRLFLITAICSLWIISFGQSQDEIRLNGNTISITGDRLTRVDGENNVWEIDLKKDETFKLISQNNRVVHYRFDKKCVEGHTGKSWKNFYEIPLKTRTDSSGMKTENPLFWNKAYLKLSKDSFPINLLIKDKIIATFRLKVNTIYQQINSLSKNEYIEGDTITFTKTPIYNEVVEINKEMVKLKLGENQYSTLKDGIIPEDWIKNGDIDSCEVIVSVSYSNGSKKDFNLGSIVIHKKEEGTGKIANLLIPIIVIILLLTAFLYRKYIRKYWDAISSRISPRNPQENTDDKQESNNPQTPLLDNIPLKEEKETIPGQNTCNQIEDDREDITKLKTKIEGQENVIKKQSEHINKLENQLASLSNASLELQQLRDRNKDLENKEAERVQEVNNLNGKISRLKEDNNILQTQLKQVNVDSATKRDLRNKIEELREEKNKLIREKQSKEQELVKERKTVSSLKNTIEQKDDKITETNKLKDEAESNLRIEKNRTLALQKKINSYSKQTYYIYTIDDTLQAVDNSLQSLFKDVRDENLMKRLAQPAVSGTTGLDAGLESYYSDWRKTVYDNPRLFFGEDVLNLSDDYVKEKLAEFLEQLALRDSFGKLVRLYLMTNVGWINGKMVAVGFDVDAIQTLFARFKNLFSLFNIEISYPHLFVDKFDPKQHKDNMRCEIFNYFEPSEELLAQLKNRENENLIVDVTRIGIPNSKTPTRRNAMVSLPNF